MSTSTDAYMARINEDLRDAAREHWKVTAEATLTILPKSLQDAVGTEQRLVYVEAEAKTGSRYVVVATPLPYDGLVKEGGAFLVTVLQPWQDAWTITGAVDEKYVREHLTGGKERAPQDVTAATLTINHTLEVATR